MAASIVDQDDNGNANAAFVFEINVMEARFASRSVVSDVYRGVRQMNNFIYSNTNIAGTIVRHYETDKSFDCNNLSRSEARQWIKNENGVGGDGAFIFLVNCNGLGLADSAGAWKNGPAVGFSPYKDDSNRRAANITCHEGLHTHVLGGICSQVRDNEHSLGGARKKTDGRDFYTPFGTGGGSGTYNGPCSTDDRSPDGFTQNPTNCTLRAIEDSRDHARGDHN